MRERAERAEHLATKQGLLRIAADFDVLADRAEQRLSAMLKRLGQGQTSAPVPSPLEAENI